MAAGSQHHTNTAKPSFKGQRSQAGAWERDHVIAASKLYHRNTMPLEQR